MKYNYIIKLNITNEHLIKSVSGPPSIDQTTNRSRYRDGKIEICEEIIIQQKVGINNIK